MSFNNAFDQNQGLMADINMTPLVDVMLVLLILFIITMPKVNHAVKIDLPQAESQLLQAEQQPIRLSLAGDGRLFWNQEPISQQEWSVRLAAAARLNPQPELHLHADRNTRYQQVAEVISAAQRLGMKKFGFVTEPTQP